MIQVDPYPVNVRINYSALGRAVLHRRTEQSLTVRGLSDLIGISAATISRVERGYTVEPEHFFTLLQYLGTDVRGFVPEEFLSDAEA